MFRFQENPEWFPQVEQQLAHGLGKALQVPKAHLKRALAPHAVTGRDWTTTYPETMVRQSSAVDEYPQEQMGDLRNSVDSIQTDLLEWQSGFFDEGYEKLLWLEMGRTWGGTGGGPLWLTFFGEDADQVRTDMLFAFVGTNRSG